MTVRVAPDQARARRSGGKRPTYCVPDVPGKLGGNIRILLGLALLGCVVRMAFPGRRTYAGMIVHTFWCTVEEEHCYRVVFDDLDMGDYTKTEVVGSLLPEDEGRALKRTSLR